MATQRRAFLSVLGGAGMALLTGCLGGDPGERTRREFTIAVTTSVDDSGVMRALNGGFERNTGTRVRTIPRGSGAAIRLARDGDVDAVIAHAPHLEAAFLDDGYATGRWPVMANSFVVVGPTDDPAQLGDVGGPAEAFARLASARTPFVSRGDGSGTHRRERELWEHVGVVPGDRWYLDIGQGMAKALFVADQIGAYTLADEGTLRTVAPPHDLSVKVGGGITDDRWLENRYSILDVDPLRHPNVDHERAMAYIDFITGEAGQAVIGAHRRDGARLFYAYDEWVAGGGRDA